MSALPPEEACQYYLDVFFANGMVLLIPLANRHYFNRQLRPNRCNQYLFPRSHANVVSRSLITEDERHPFVRLILTKPVVEGFDQAFRLRNLNCPCFAPFALFPTFAKKNLKCPETVVVTELILNQFATIRKYGV